MTKIPVAIEKEDELDCINTKQATKSFVQQNPTSDLKRQTINWEIISNFYHRGLLSLIYNECPRFEKKKTNNLREKKWAKYIEIVHR